MSNFSVDFDPEPLLLVRSSPSFEVSGYLHTGLFIAGGVCFASVAAYSVFTAVTDPMGNFFLSRVVAGLVKLTDQPINDAGLTRTTFTDYPCFRVPTLRNHSHPRSAACRNIATKEMELVCGLLGRKPFFAQLSQSDVRAGRNGSRSYHWARDIVVPPSAHSPDKTDVVCIVDTDHYVDMPDLLARDPRVYLIYTFQPTSVATSGEYSFTFIEDEIVKYVVSGGAEYVHRVWNYGSDVLVASTRIWLGTCVRTTVYNVDRRAVDEHHVLICLTPTRTFVSPFVDLSPWLGGSKLSRLVVGDGSGFTRLDVQSNKGLMRCTGRLGCHASATIPVAQDDALAALSRMGKTDITLALVKVTTGIDDPVSASVLTEFHRAKTGTKVSKVYPPELGVKHYDFSPLPEIEPPRPSVIPFMSPLIVGGCYAPAQSFGNDEAAVKGRVLEIAPNINLDEANIVHQRFVRYMEEFVNRVVKKPHQGVPVDLETVEARQKRPSQRRILDQAAQSTKIASGDVLSDFMKKECYDVPKDPRLISTMPGSEKMHYSRYLYAISDSFCDQDWYAFGKTPKEIAFTVARLCHKASSVTGSDLSRMDGRVSGLLRVLEQMLALRFFKECYHDEVKTLMRTQSGRRAVTRFGVFFHTGSSRCSGSPETAAFNSADNAYMAYSTHREAGCTPEESWANIGIYGGDDGLTPDVDPVVYTRTCAVFGQILEAEVVHRGDLGVNFLNRFYSRAVWFGCPDSHSNVFRAVSKLHCTVALPPDVTPFDKLKEKLSGYYLTDRFTPILGDIADLFVSIHGVVEPTWGIANYFSGFGSDNQFPNENWSNWMDESVFVGPMKAFDIDRMHDWLNDIDDNRATFICAPVCLEIDVREKPQARDFRVDGDLTKKVSKPVVAAVVVSPKKESTPPAPKKVRSRGRSRRKPELKKASGKPLGGNRKQ